MMCAMDDCGRPWGAPAPRDNGGVFARAILVVIVATVSWALVAGIWWLVR